MTPLIIGGAKRSISSMSTIVDGKSGKTVSELLTAILFPVKLTVKGIEQIESYLEEKITLKIVNIPEKYRKLPDLSIVGPAIEAMRFYSDEEGIKELFIELISSTIDSRKVKDIHHSFVDVIKHISPDEAKILKYIQKNKISCIPVLGIRETRSSIYADKVYCFNDLPERANCKILENRYLFIENFARLGILERRECNELDDKRLYEVLAETKPFKERYEKCLSVVEKDSEFEIEIVRSQYIVNEYGRKFIVSVVGDYTWY